MRPVDAYRPLLGVASLRLLVSDLAVDDHLLVVPAPVDVDARVHRVADDLDDATRGRFVPHQLPAPDAVSAYRNAHSVLSRPARDSVGARLGRVAFEDEPDPGLHRFIWFNFEAMAAPHIPGRRPDPQLASSRLALQRSVQAQLNPVQLRFRHRALDVEQELVVPVGRIVDSLLVADDDLRDGAERQQALPVHRRACEARDLDREDGADFSVHHSVDQPREARSTFGRRSTVPEVFVDDFDRRFGPAQRRGASGQRVLPLSRLAVLEHLSRRRLPHVYARAATQMRRIDPRGHGRPRFRCSPPRRPRAASGQRACSTRAATG